jgi:glycosyltransferase involved in cell wall biosynthesis
MNDAPSAMTRSPLISVIVLTYNHQRYIAEAVRSVLAQTWVHDCEILIADDASTDGTAAILDQLAAEQPLAFRRLPRPQNLGLSRNLETAWQECRGKYIAILEGDDVWSDPAKLQLVVTQLEAHPAWTGCFHDVTVEREGVISAGEFLTARPSGETVTVEELLLANRVTTYSSMVYRRGVVPQFPDWHRCLINGDYALHILHAEHGPLGYLPQPCTLYRVHAHGLWSSLDRGGRWMHVLKLYAYLEWHFAGRYASALQAAREVFLKEHADLVKIAGRYRGLGLEWLAGLLKSWTKQSE